MGELVVCARSLRTEAPQVELHRKSFGLVLLIATRFLLCDGLWGGVNYACSARRKRQTW